MNKKHADIACPCGSGKAYDDCCRPLIDGDRPASDAEALMRSRYTAYALHHESWLLDSWHPSTRPASLDPDPALQWLRLKILDAGDGHVEFVATFRIQGKAHRLHEKSRFVNEDGKWYYLDGDIEE